MADPVSLNEYTLTDSVGTPKKVMATEMAIACSTYKSQMTEDPATCRLTGEGILTVQPASYTTFKTVVYDASGLAESAGCKATPSGYTVTNGSTVIFEAIAVEGFKFSKWLIDGTAVTGDEGTANPATLTIPAKDTVVTVTAQFVTSVGG